MEEIRPREEVRVPGAPLRCENKRMYPENALYEHWWI